MYPKSPLERGNGFENCGTQIFKPRGVLEGAGARMRLQFYQDSGEHTPKSPLERGPLNCHLSIILPQLTTLKLLRVGFWAKLEALNDKGRFLFKIKGICHPDDSHH
ncbi:hypothetical protein DYD21_12460 [Rhodohalobacter sp. SW132]|nr:hypothetical protein DYD21_12460 [Rhodohalobacter sp. SW132]